MLCPQICVHTSHSSQQEWGAHIWENILGFEELIKQQSQKENRDRAEDKESCTGLRKERREWTAPDLSDQPVQSCLNNQDKASFLKDFCSTNVSIKATFTGQWGKPWTKLLEACQQKKYEGADPITIQFLFLKKNPILPLKWSDSTYKSGHSQLIQAEEGIISPLASKAKGDICTMILSTGVAVSRSNITPGLQSSQMHWLFGE